MIQNIPLKVNNYCWIICRPKCPSLVPRPKLWDGRWQKAAIPTVTKHLDGDVGSAWQEGTCWGTLSLPNYSVWAMQWCWPIAGSHWRLKACMMRKRENLMENTTCQHFKISWSEINGWDYGFQPRFTPKSEYLFPAASQTSYPFFFSEQISAVRFLRGRAASTAWC